MCEHVSCKTTALIKGFFTHFACIRILSSVCAHVLSKVTAITNDFITNVASIRLSFCVRSHVSFYLEIVYKSPPTDIAIPHITLRRLLTT